MSKAKEYKDAMNSVRFDETLENRILEGAGQTEREEELNRSVQQKVNEETRPKSRTFYGWKRWASAGVAACLVFGVLGASGAFRKTPGNLSGVPNETEAQREGRGEFASMVSLDGTVTAAAEYKELYNHMSALMRNRESGGGIIRYATNGLGLAQKSDLAVNSVEDMPMTEASEAPAAVAPLYGDAWNADVDYSTTNLQVAGIDEADVVKTNGRYIFALSRNEQKLFIVQAAGADSKLVTAMDLNIATERHTNELGGDINVFINNSDMYLAGNQVILMRTVNVYDGGGHSKWGGYYSEETTEALYIDVSDPQNPKLQRTVGLDGNYLTSRINNGVLYLVTNYYTYVNSDVVKEDVPATYIPETYNGGMGTLIPCRCIGYLPDVESSTYLNVAAFDLNDGTLLGTQSILGAGNTVYMSANNLYVALSQYKHENSEPTVDGIYNVTTYEEKNVTTFMRFGLHGGNVQLEAQATADGRLLNQWAMDEYDGTFRTVLTAEPYSYTVYEDPNKGFVNFVYGDNKRYCDLLVLDADTMECIGAIHELAQDEMVKSVRFSGSIGYVVTFRQTDPLFAIDFTDPTTPTVLSALKIPGFSQYLHPYGDGLLLGLGMNVNDGENWTDRMKLSMFDVSDPTNVTEVAFLKLDADYSAALDNHKAILVAPEKNLIAFPTYEGYHIYGYDAASKQFSLRGSVSMKYAGGDNWYWAENLYDARGNYINDCFYVTGPMATTVLDLETLQVLTNVVYGDTDLTKRIVY